MIPPRHVAMLGSYRGALCGRVSPFLCVSSSTVKCFSKLMKITTKKPKCSDGQQQQEQEASPPRLSDEQLGRMAQNKQAALEKLRANQTPAGVGDAWSRALAAEFGKPYFKQVQ